MRPPLELAERAGLEAEVVRARRSEARLAEQMDLLHARLVATEHDLRRTKLALEAMTRVAAEAQQALEQYRALAEAYLAAGEKP